MATGPLPVWDHLPHFVRSIIVGNIVQIIFIAILGFALKRHAWMQPVIDKVGPKKLRSATAKEKAGGCLAAIAWFLLSWYVGHACIILKNHLVTWIMPK